MIFKRNKEKVTRIFFATDIHGSEKCFKKFVNAGKFYNVDALILGGDLTGKMLVPIVEHGQTYKYSLFEDNFEAKAEDLPSVEEKIRTMGYYPLITSPKDFEELSAKPERVHEIFQRLAVETLKRWVSLAEERLKDSGIKFYIAGGNDDDETVEPILDASEYIVNPEGKVINFDGKHEMISSAYSNLTPWKTPRELPEEQLERKIQSMIEKLENVKTAIFNLHAPPINSQLDTCVELDTSVYPPKPIFEGGSPKQYSAGSSAVRNLIEKYQPLLGLHGHIHESRGAIYIGRTLCINPGSEYGEGILRGAIILLEPDKVKSFQLTSG